MGQVGQVGLVFPHPCLPGLPGGDLFTGLREGFSNTAGGGLSLEGLSGCCRVGLGAGAGRRKAPGGGFDILLGS